MKDCREGRVGAEGRQAVMGGEEVDTERSEGLCWKWERRRNKELKRAR
jgi:hypothetical protein